MTRKPINTPGFFADLLLRATDREIRDVQETRDFDSAELRELFGDDHRIGRDDD